jgi:general secretion pathway protein F/type IV pilus assembly protein PilC
MLFSYKGIDSSGKKLSDKIEANSIEEAKSKLKSSKIIYTQIKEENFDINKFNIFNSRVMMDENTLSTISRDISIYLGSGIQIVQAISLISGDYSDDKKLYPFFNSILANLNEGKNLYQALENQTIYKLPEFYKQSIKVSEDGGILAEVLLELSLFLKEHHRTKKQVKNAMSYPAFMLVVSVFMVIFMLTYIVPKITSIFDQLNQELPAISQFVVDAGLFFQNNYQIMLISIFSFVTIYSFLYSKNYKFKYFINRQMLRLPLFGQLIENSELARFSYISSVLLRSGVPFTQAVSLSSNTLDNEVLKELFFESSKKIVEGEQLSKVLNNYKKYRLNKSFIRSVALGEETSELEPILQNLAKLYNENNKDKIDLILSMMEPFLMLFVGGMIGFIVLAMLLPIFSMNIG